MRNIQVNKNLKCGRKMVKIRLKDMNTGVI